MAIAPETVGGLPLVVQSFASRPESISDPWALVGTTIAAGAVAAYMWRISDPSKITGLAHEPSNPGAIRKTVIDIESSEDKTSTVEDRWYRAGSPFMTSLGALMVAGAFFAGPHFNTTSLVPNRNTVVAIETSYPFLNTHDMPGDVSRFDLATDSIADSKFDGNMAVVQYGQNVQITMPLEPFNKNSFLANVNTSAINPNGNDLSDALIQSASILPNHKGDIVAITDGIGVNNVSSESVSTTVDELAKEGINTKIVVLGTSNSDYVINHSNPLPADPEMSAFEGVNPKDIVSASSPANVEADLASAIGKPVSTKENHFWYPSLAPGLLVGLYGLMRDVRQRSKKLI